MKRGKMNMSSKSFEFQRNELTLKIERKNYRVISEGLEEKMQKYHSIWENMIPSEESGDIKPQDIINECRKITNDLLGSGTFEKIFKKREQVVNDCVDLVLFILGEIKEYFENHAFPFRQPPPPPSSGSNVSIP
jgi:hypothetical protein